MKFGFAVLLAAALANAAAPPNKETEALLALARTAPPEIFADSIVKLVESGKITGVDAQKTLLESAFAAAGQAREPIRLIPLPGLGPDNRASDLQLDVLSLQTRVLRALLTVDRALAREKFSSITRPHLDVQVCEDPLIPDASSYYAAAGAIA